MEIDCVKSSLNGEISPNLVTLTGSVALFSFLNRFQKKLVESRKLLRREIEVSSSPLSNASCPKSSHHVESHLHRQTGYSNKNFNDHSHSLISGPYVVFTMANIAAKYARDSDIC